MSSQRHALSQSAEEQTVEAPLFTDPEPALHAARDVVGRKWNPILLFYLLQDGPLGFSALKDRTDGISSKMLSESLSELEEHGLVDRTLLDEKPVRVEYAVSETGESLGPVIQAMVEWGSQEGT
jgi:DNA-binding HxlR family transcriptional regulator